MAITRITGTQTRAIYKLGTTGTAFGTAVAGGANDRIRGNISTSFQSQELMKNPIGSGLIMLDDVIAGRMTPSITITGDVGFRSGADRIAAQFFGTSSVGSEITPAQADYLHKLSMNAVANSVYGTIAYEMTTAKVGELPSCACKSFSTSFGDTDEIVQFSAEFMGDSFNTTSVTNTNATIGSATMTDSECVIVKTADDFWLNVESAGALSSGDQYNIVSYSRVLNRPQAFSGQVRGTSGNTAPLADEIIDGTVSITIEALDDVTKFDSWLAGTFFKCKLNIEGTQIGTGSNKTWTEWTPRMKLIQAPKYDITDAGYNTVSMEFKILEASANPTGMDFKLPYVSIINGRSTTYIA